MTPLENRLSSYVKATAEQIKQTQVFSSFLQFDLKQGDTIKHAILDVAQLLDETGVRPELLPTIAAFTCAMLGNVNSLLSASFIIRLERSLPDNLLPEDDIKKIIAQYGDIEKHPDAKEMVHFIIDDGETTIDTYHVLRFDDGKTVFLDLNGERETLDSKTASLKMGFGGILHRASLIGAAHDNEILLDFEKKLTDLPREDVVFMLLKNIPSPTISKSADIARMLVKSYGATGQFFLEATPPVYLH